MVGGIRTHTAYVLSVVSPAFGLQPRTPGGSRTLTDADLNRMPLPTLGYRGIGITPAGLEPRIARLKVSYPGHLDEGAIIQSILLQRIIEAPQSRGVLPRSKIEGKEKACRGQHDRPDRRYDHEPSISFVL